MVSRRGLGSDAHYANATMCTAQAQEKEEFGFAQGGNGAGGEKEGRKRLRRSVHDAQSVWGLPYCYLLYRKANQLRGRGRTLPLTSGCQDVYLVSWALGSICVCTSTCSACACIISGLLVEHGF